MAKFQASGFSIDLPDGTFDASSYVFSFPFAGDLSPSLSISFERVADIPDLMTIADKEAGTLRSNLESFDVLAESQHERGTWRYVISIVEWGPREARIWQKRFFLFVPDGRPTLYTIKGTDLSENRANSEPIFDQTIASFDPNGFQAL